MTQRRISKPSSTAERFAALNRVGTALMSELDEARLLHMIAETACELTSASFAAFTLRPIDEEGKPLVPSEGNLFHLAAVVGVSKEQEKLFRRMPLGGEGLLAPIFRYGAPVLVDDAIAHMYKPGEVGIASHTEPHTQVTEQRDSAQERAFAYSHGFLPKEELRSMGVPRGHPIIRSFLGVPVLNREQEVRGGLLLGHTRPGCFTEEDKALLIGLAGQASVALENARLYRLSQMRAQELNAIFDSIADGVTLVNNRGDILRENAAARQLREQLQESPEGERAIDALLHQPAQHALKAEEKQNAEVQVVDGYQERREFIVSASPLHAPKTPSSPLKFGHRDEVNDQDSASRAVVVWHDVTEVRRMLKERHLYAETEARRALLQMLLDELPSSVYLVRGQDARLVLANHAATALWGAAWQVGEAMGDFLKRSGIRLLKIDGRVLTPEEYITLRAVRHGETVRHYQEIIRYADGTTVPVLVNAVALDASELNLVPSDATGGTHAAEPAALLVHQDVTALKEAERLKDDFIGIAAHELRTPLAILKGFAQMLLVQTARGKGADLADWQMEALQSIDQATLRMVELIEDLLDVTRLQGGRLELYIEPVDMVALLRRVIARLQVTTEQHTLALHAAMEHFVVEADPRRIEQVLHNVLNNAIKYSPQGGLIDISISRDPETSGALVSVKDHGIGIPAEQQAGVFGRFVRAENARELGIGGTGLGLYLCRELIERHGGRIWFESAENQGTTFFIVLPSMPDER
ncbi:MAG TPA: ATP-binding protein [Ktedonosporobacter sp.]|jgi:signal transduction histidine kinase/GAF domain-containing protein|nr:ATP-binding protein [Ktedonosporobacter sp.]